MGKIGFVKNYLRVKEVTTDSGEAPGLQIFKTHHIEQKSCMALILKITDFFFTHND
jgi:hypothetical protein